jgi:hypothetical protein
MIATDFSFGVFLEGEDEIHYSVPRRLENIAFRRAEDQLV